MLDPTVTAYLTKLLCSHGGQIEISRLVDLLDRPEEQIKQILQEDPLRFPQSAQLVLARSSLRICSQYLYPNGPDGEEEEEECPKLHICRQYLEGHCFPNRRPRCRFSHDIMSDHNRAVLEANELSGLNEKEIKVLLFQNDNQLLPRDCVKYLHGSCDQGEDCPRLHLCRYFTRGECNQRFCKRSHNLLESKIILNCGWLSQETIENFQMICEMNHKERHREEDNRRRGRGQGEGRGRGEGRDRGRSRGRADSQDSEESEDRSRTKSLSRVQKTPEICLPNIWMFCKLGGRCTEMHYYLPYRWQELNGVDWVDLPNIEDIEMAYSDPSQDRYQSINLEAMKVGTRDVRRLTTPSSVTRPPEYVLTTEWFWYWKDEFGTWTKYGQSNTKNVSASLQSSDLETIYLSDPNGSFRFTAGNQTYVINFKEMRQKNIQYGTEKEVRRRPKFLDFQKVKKLKGSTKSATVNPSQKSSDSLLKAVKYLTHWDPKAMPEIGFKKVLVSEKSQEFTNIVRMFSRTVARHVVKGLWRIQNPALWQIYTWQKDLMKKKNSGNDVDERQLFHGTDNANIDAICRDNFDWRVCGTNGTVYGQGSYFARDASYSHNYSHPTPEGTRSMFVARVLVGDFAVGDSKMRLPPMKNRTESYDSCVDKAGDPSIFVIFEKLQIYPEYILKYEEEKKSSCVIC